MQHVAPLKILKASAGSGKTFSLAVHYITLLLWNEYSYKEILAVTFTNKATAEMKDRILTVLRNLAIGDESGNTQAYRAELQQQFPQWSPADIAQKAHRVYRRILHDYSHFTVSTIDGFSQKVIRGFTYELNLEAAYQIEMNTKKVQAELTVMLNNLLDERPDLLEWIISHALDRISKNKNWNYRHQLKALAGLIFTENFKEFDAHIATTGSTQLFELLNKEVQTKTKTFIQSVNAAIRAYRELYQQVGIDPNRMHQRSRNRLVTAAKKAPHAEKLTPTDLIKLTDEFVRIIGDEQTFTVDKEVDYRLMVAFAPILDRFAQLQSMLPQHIAYQSVQDNLYYLRLLKEMSDLLATWRKENTAQLISDAQILLNKLGLDQNDDPTFIWEKIGNRYNYFLFDEFQDTSRIQWKNYSPILLNAMANTRGQQHEHLIVGDVKQSIYRWRNGDWRILLQQIEEQVMQRFHLNESTKNQLIHNDSLVQNFRSLPRIIAFNNHVYKHLPKLLQRVLNDKLENELDEQERQWWYNARNDDMLIRAYADAEQSVPTSKQDNPDRQGSIEINYLPVKDGRARANQVRQDAIVQLCDKIGEWVRSGRYQPQQIGILVRTNSEATAVVEALLSYKNSSRLDFEVISGDALSLAGNDGVQLIIETLRAFVQQSDAQALHHARMAYLYRRIRTPQPFALDDWLLFKDEDIHQLHELLPPRLIEHWEHWRTLPLMHLVEKLIELYGLGTDRTSHLPYVLAFKDLVEAFTLRGERGITPFLTYWEDDGQDTKLPSSDEVNAIEVLTVHRSKGLAYDVVMVPFCSWRIDGKINDNFWVDTEGTPFEPLGRIPLKYNASLGQSLFYRQYYEEMLFNYMDALNTLYVATTRAVEHLYLIAPAFKETVDKKTGEVSDEIKNDYIGDLLHQVLNDADSPFGLIDKQVTIDQPISRDQTAECKDTEGRSIALTSYPLSQALETAWNKPSTRNINTILMMDAAAKYGLLAHEVMAEVQQEIDIDRIVARYIDEGVLPMADRDTLLHEIRQIWHQPTINSWLTGAYKVWNEAAIITTDGNTLRPDKVFTSPDETIVLDFKFTTDNYQSHKVQVDEYIGALLSLGYRNVRGYLYYAKNNELVEVK